MADVLMSDKEKRIVEETETQVNAIFNFLIFLFICKLL